MSCLQIHKCQISDVIDYYLWPHIHLQPDQFREDALWDLLNHRRALEKFDKYPEIPLARYFRSYYGLDTSQSLLEYMETSRSQAVKQQQDAYESILFS